METKTLTDAEIVELNAKRKVPCISDSGECWIVRTAKIYDDGEHFEVDGLRDVNVFATQRKAHEFVAKMALEYDLDDTPYKFASYIYCHNVEL